MLVSDRKVIGEMTPQLGSCVQLQLVLAIALTLGSGGGGVVGASSQAIQTLFDAVPLGVSIIGGSSCPAAAAAELAADSAIECAALAAKAGRRYFGFASRTCVLTNAQGCAGAAPVFRRRLGGTVSASHGYEEVMADGRRFWVFQQRRTGNVSFARNWTDYEQGFGDAVEFWSGLGKISSLIRNPGNILRIEMKTVDGAFFIAEWSNFTVDNASTNYAMNYGTYLANSSNTTGGDALTTHRGMKFSTLDSDNDGSEGSCSRDFGSGGFWFNDCSGMNPNGRFSATDQAGSQEYISCLCVLSWKTLRDVRMMLSIVV